MGAETVGGASQRLEPEYLKPPTDHPPDSHLSGGSLAAGSDLLAVIAAVLKHMTTCYETVVQVCFSHLTCESAKGANVTLSCRAVAALAAYSSQTDSTEQLVSTDLLLLKCQRSQF